MRSARSLAIILVVHLAVVVLWQVLVDAFHVPKFILPSTLDNLEQGRDIVGLSLVSALWCRYFAGTTDSGKEIVFNDASADRLHEAALKAKTDPMAFLAFEDIFGEVAKSELFRKRFAHALKTLWEKGTR